VGGLHGRLPHHRLRHEMFHVPFRDTMLQVCHDFVQTFIRSINISSSCRHEFSTEDTTYYDTQCSTVMLIIHQTIQSNITANIKRPISLIFHLKHTIYSFLALPNAPFFRVPLTDWYSDELLHAFMIFKKRSNTLEN
jgi:hypothetical protein